MKTRAEVLAAFCLGRGIVVPYDRLLSDGNCGYRSPTKGARNVTEVKNADTCDLKQKTLICGHRVFDSSA